MVDAVNESIMPLPGHEPTANYTPVEAIRRAKESV